MGFKSSLKIGSKIFDQAERSRVFSKVVVDNANDFQKSTVQKMVDGPHTGRVYRRRGRVHQASARGERPAPDTKRLIGGIVVTKGGEFTAEVDSTARRNGFDYPEHLQMEMERKIVTKEDVAAADSKFLKETEDALKSLL